MRSPPGPAVVATISNTNDSHANSLRREKKRVQIDILPR
jgi:hypothetical protein